MLVKDLLRSFHRMPAPSENIFSSFILTVKQKWLKLTSLHHVTRMYLLIHTKNVSSASPHLLCKMKSLHHKNNCSNTHFETSKTHWQLLTPAANTGQRLFSSPEANLLCLICDCRAKITSPRVPHPEKGGHGEVLAFSTSEGCPGVAKEDARWPQLSHVNDRAKPQPNIQVFWFFFATIDILSLK